MSSSNGHCGKGSGATFGTWEYEEHGIWSAFDSNANELVESAFASGATEVETSPLNGRTGESYSQPQLQPPQARPADSCCARACAGNVNKYKFDLKKLVQINTVTDFECPIRRTVPASSSAAAAGKALPAKAPGSAGKATAVAKTAPQKPSLGSSKAAAKALKAAATKSTTAAKLPASNSKQVSAGHKALAVDEAVEILHSETPHSKPSTLNPTP